MSTTEARTGDAAAGVEAAKSDMSLEVVVLPVADTERAKEFYLRLGWRLDADVAVGDDLRLVQVTPKGSGCSIQFGDNLTTAPPGSSKGAYLVVPDIAAARADLLGRGIEVSDVFHEGHLGDRFHEPGRVPGASTNTDNSYQSFATFSDPDGNVWLLQEITHRLPGRVDEAVSSYSSAEDLAAALRRAEAAHGEHETRIGAADPNWPDWYATYMVQERTGGALPT